MDGRRFLAVLIGCLLTASTLAAQVPGGLLADVERLYAAAAFEDALAALDRISGQADADQVDEYRALCFVGLDRTRDAEEAVERLVMRKRGSAYDLASQPPKFVALYRAVKKRILPAVALALYGSAKASFERGQFVIAAAQFKELLVMLSDPEDAETLGDLRVLADGFSRLSEARLADVSPPARQPPPAENAALASPAGNAPAALPTGIAPAALPAGDALAAPPAGNPRAVSASKPSIVVYGSEDLDVIPPAIIDQRMPAWIPPHPLLATQRFRGILEIIIGVDGAVESRIMSEPAFPFYDRDLLNAAQQWRYLPATRNGRPVKYRKVITVTLGGSARNE